MKYSFINLLNVIIGAVMILIGSFVIDKGFLQKHNSEIVLYYGNMKYLIGGVFIAYGIYILYCSIFKKSSGD